MIFYFWRYGQTTFVSSGLHSESWIYSARRDRLTTDRAAVLVFIAYNSALRNNNVLDGQNCNGGYCQATVETKINESDNRGVNIESEVSMIIIFLHDSSDEMENFHLEDEV